MPKSRKRKIEKPKHSEASRKRQRAKNAKKKAIKEQKEFDNYIKSLIQF